MFVVRLFVERVISKCRVDRSNPGKCVSARKFNRERRIRDGHPPNGALKVERVSLLAEL